MGTHSSIHKNSNLFFLLFATPPMHDSHHTPKDSMQLTLWKPSTSKFSGQLLCQQ
jgi:sterol desaturase/sphingolipid hydroxylase (fatty acid hydroxylase superfamily)